MQGKVLGVPLVLLTLILLIVVPLGLFDLHLSQQVAALQKPCAPVVVVPTPTVVPSVSPVKGLRSSVPATESGAAR